MNIIPNYFNDINFIDENLKILRELNPGDKLGVEILDGRKRIVIFRNIAGASIQTGYRTLIGKLGWYEKSHTHVLSALKELVGKIDTYIIFCIEQKNKAELAKLHQSLKGVTEKLPHLIQSYANRQDEQIKFDTYLNIFKDLFQKSDSSAIPSAQEASLHLLKNSIVFDDYDSSLSDTLDKETYLKIFQSLSFSQQAIHIINLAEKLVEKLIEFLKRSDEENSSEKEIAKSLVREKIQTILQELQIKKEYHSNNLIQNYQYVKQPNESKENLSIVISLYKDLVDLSVKIKIDKDVYFDQLDFKDSIYLDKLIENNKIESKFHDLRNFENKLEKNNFSDLINEFSMQAIYYSVQSTIKQFGELIYNYNFNMENNLDIHIDNINSLKEEIKLQKKISSDLSIKKRELEEEQNKLLSIRDDPNQAVDKMDIQKLIQENKVKQQTISIQLANTKKEIRLSEKAKESFLLIIKRYSTKLKKNEATTHQLKLQLQGLENRIHEVSTPLLSQKSGVDKEALTRIIEELLKLEELILSFKKIDNGTEGDKKSEHKVPFFEGTLYRLNRLLKTNQDVLSYIRKYINV